MIQLNYCIMCNILLINYQGMDMTNNFGKFFHSVRTSKGMSLMTFCRENQLNVVSVSSIERGTFVPAKDEIAKYLKALKIKSGTKNYKKFIDLYEVKRNEKENRVPLILDIPKEKLAQVMEILSKNA